jgi:hypothetical protein
MLLKYPVMSTSNPPTHPPKLYHLVYPLHRLFRVSFWLEPERVVLEVRLEYGF